MVKTIRQIIEKPSHSALALLGSRLLMAAPLLVSACAVGPDYVNPTILMPSSFKEAPEG